MPPLPLPTAITVSGELGQRSSQPAPRLPRRAQRLPPANRLPAVRGSPGRGLVASAMIVAMPLLSLRERTRSSCGSPVSGSLGLVHQRAHRNERPRLPLFFRWRCSRYFPNDDIIIGWGGSRPPPVRRHRGARGGQVSAISAVASKAATAAGARGVYLWRAAAGLVSAGANVFRVDELVRRGGARRRAAVAFPAGSIVHLPVDGLLRWSRLRRPPRSIPIPRPSEASSRDSACYSPTLGRGVRT